MSSSQRAKALAFITSCLVALIMVVPLVSVRVMAQATTGTLRGTVTDAQGGVVAGAIVTVKNEATGTSTAPIKTTGEGIFEAAALQPGTYTVTVEGTGFKRSVSTNVAVKIGIVNPLAVVLEAGNVSETVTVTADTQEIIQRDQAQISTTVNTRQVQDLPSNGASSGLDTLALLAPGVINQRSTGANTNGTGLSVNGNRGRSNNFQIDGADNNDLSVTGPALFVDFQDQVQEYQVITNNFSAQYGRNQGAIINIVTKGGTNEFHGSAFDLHQDAQHLNSLNNIERRSGQTRPNRNLLNVFGGTVGGPLFLPRFGEGGKSVYNGKNRLFFFFGYQGVRNPNSTTASTTSLSILSSEFTRLQSTFPTSGVIQAYVRYSPFAISSPAPALPNSFVAGTPGLASVNTNPASGCPRAILTGSAPPAGCAGYVPTTFLIGGPYDIVNLGTAAAPQLFQAAQYQRTVSTPYTENYYNLRFDAKATERDSITVRFLNQKSANVGGAACCTNGFIGDVPAGSKHFGGSWTRTLSSKMVNEFRANYQRIIVDFGGGCKTGDPGCIPPSSDIGVALANIAFPVALGLTKTSSALGTIGPATNLPQGRTGKVYQYADNLNWSRGRHSWLFGAEYKHLIEVTPFLPNFNGAYSFNSAARITNNAPSAVAITLGDPTLAFTENDQYYYAQDDFKIRPNLTLNLGVRYEFTGQPINVLHDQTVTRESNASTAFFNPALPLSLRTVPLVPSDKNNFAPRFGFAWSPKFWKSFLGEDATVIRGGYSIAYDAAFYNILLNVQNAAPFSVALTIPSTSLTSTTTSPAPLPGNPTGDVVRASAQASGVLPKGVLNPIYLSQTTVANDFRAPYAEQWSFGIQHQFGRRHVAEVRYVGTHGVGLFTNINGNFFVGPLVNGFNVTRNSSGSLVRCASSPTTPCLNARSFANLLPPGTRAQVCVDNPATLDLENACNDRQLPQGGITTRANASQSIYHGLQSRYNGRFFKDSVSLGLSYTWSKAIDDESDIFARTDISTPNAQNPFCINRCERGLSAVDRPHAFSANFIWDIPVRREQRGILGRLLGGWQLNGTFFLTSGAAFTPSQSSTFNSAVGNSYLTNGDRPFLGNSNVDRRQVGINNFDAFLLGKISVAQFNALNNPNGFINLTTLTSTGSVVSVTPNDVKYIYNGPGAAQVFGSPFGSAGRNIERGPVFNQLNLGVFKNIKIKERFTMQLRGEFFNALNHPTPGVGNTVGGGYLPDILVTDAGLSSSAFGNNQDITFARRVIQVGLRLVF
jgi:outer membrane receptor protein involved in Fe transport